MPRLFLEAIVYRDAPGWATYPNYSVGWWDDPRIDGHAILRLEQPIVYPEVPIFITIPFRRAGELREVYGKDAKGGDLERLAWAWNGNRGAPSIGVISTDPAFDLRPSFVWPKDPMGSDWPQVHIFIQNGRLVNAGSHPSIEVVP